MIPILMYHQVAEVPRALDPLGLAVPPAQFEQQMGCLARNGCHCLSLAEAVQYFRKNSQAPSRSFVLTFDDGYQDFHQNAAPILEKIGFTATIFLVSGRLGSRSNWWGQNEARSGQLLSWSEAQDLAQRGFILGSHTNSHPFLIELDEKTAYEEIWSSKELLQDRLGVPVDFFSYPYSSTDARIERLVDSAGYEAACAGSMGPKSIFHLWRVPCGRNDTKFSLIMKANGWYDRRTALRESEMGRFLRQTVRRLRRRPAVSHTRQPDILSHDLPIDLEKKP